MIELPPQLFCGKQRPIPSRFSPVVGGSYGEIGHKPKGGFWTSTWETAFEDGWPAWCWREGFRSCRDGWLLMPKPCRVLTIEDERTALSFMDAYGEDLDQKAPGLLVYPNWIRVARDWDAVRLTAPYDPALRFGMNTKIGSTFYGWDCESTVWLSWQFRRGPKFLDLSEIAKLKIKEYEESWV